METTDPTVLSSVPASRNCRFSSTLYLILITGVAALGGLLFGYDTAVISGAIGLLQVHFALTAATTVRQGGAYAHNLFCGGIRLTQFDKRLTPFMKPHSTEVAGLHDNPSGDMRFYNNVFAQAGDPMTVKGNVFLGTAKPSTQEATPLLKPDFDPGIRLIETEGTFHLEMNLDSKWAAEQHRDLVTTELLGMATIPNLPFVQADNAPIRIDTDYSGQPRNTANPFPGPFEKPEGGKLSISIPAAKKT